MIYITNVDLVNEYVHTKFGLNRSIRFQDIEQKLISVTLLQICRNSNLFKLSCMSSLPARMKKVKFKMMVLDCLQDFSHYKSMGIFPDAQGHLTLQSIIRAAQFSNSFKTFWLSSLPAKMTKIQSKIEAQECVHNIFPIITLWELCVAMETRVPILPGPKPNAINFSNAQGQITLELVVVFGRNLNSSKLSCMSSLPARITMINSKMKALECSQDFPNYKSMWIFPDAQGQLTPKSLVRSGRISNASKM